MGRKIFLSVFLILLVAPVSKGWAGSSISQATNWAYQLQAAAPAQLAASKYEVIVIDYSRDGTDAGAYKAG
jgi:cysteinyl-tRNA synthetase